MGVVLIFALFELGFDHQNAHPAIGVGEVSDHVIARWVDAKRQFAGFSRVKQKGQIGAPVAPAFIFADFEIAERQVQRLFLIEDIAE